MRAHTRRLFPEFLVFWYPAKYLCDSKAKKKKPTQKTPATTLSLRSWHMASEWSVNSFVSTQTIFKYSGSIFRPQTISASSAQEPDSEIQAYTNNPFCTRLANNTTPASEVAGPFIYLFI